MRSTAVKEEGREKMREKNVVIPQHPTAETLAIFFHLNPTLMKMNEDPMAARNALKKGRSDFLPASIFLKKSAGHMARV